jgi:formylglycine-generating enzyme required for sulfatase activity
LHSLKDSQDQPLYECWQDKHSIPPGQDWWKAIVKGIEDCQIFIFMLSRESAQNENCRAELSYARRRNRPILPIVLHNEFDYNPTTGKNDIVYWELLPPELNDIRAQFLFYEGAMFVKMLAEACAEFDRKGYRDIPAEPPTDPRESGQQPRDTASLYDQACDAALKMDLPTAERRFQQLIDWGDRHFTEDAYEWMQLLRDYSQLALMDERANTRHKIPALWATYRAKFPKPFIALFDPRDFRSRYDDPQPPPPPVRAQPVAPPPTDPARHAELVHSIIGRPFEWCPVTAGEVTIADGIGKKQVKPFWMAKYPVTNSQFKVFVEAGGYQERQWWTDLGWQAREQGWVWDGGKSDFVPGQQPWSKPRYWDDAKFNQDEQPVVGVSFWEGLAFANWLSAAVVRTGYIPSVGAQHAAPLPMTIRLPTEAEWQHAAQGDDGRIYPWGNNWDCARCTNSVSPCNNDKTTPVRYYGSKGASPFGVVDMAGNVWEWCLTEYDSGRNDDLNNSNRRVLRGGSWWNSNTNWFRCDYRSWSHPDVRVNNDGFRLSFSY